MLVGNRTQVLAEIGEDRDWHDLNHQQTWKVWILSNKPWVFRWFIFGDSSQYLLKSGYVLLKSSWTYQKWPDFPRNWGLPSHGHRASGSTSSWSICDSKAKAEGQSPFLAQALRTQLKCTLFTSAEHHPAVKKTPKQRKQLLCLGSIMFYHKFLGLHHYFCHSFESSSHYLLVHRSWAQPLVCCGHTP